MGASLWSAAALYPEFQLSLANIEIKGHLPPVLGNQAGLTQCFSNLLGNAIKFVQPGQNPSIRIWAESVTPSTLNPQLSTLNFCRLRPLMLTH